MKTRSDLEAALAGVRLGAHLPIFGSAGARDRRVRRWLRENGLALKN
ncbi:MAG: hypothetical protein J6K46_09080 [Sutterella sp.]|nr:hypothetical protein [Sutterella sp.]